MEILRFILIVISLAAVFLKAKRMIDAGRATSGESRRARLALRFSRVMTYAVGAIIILAAIGLGVRKALHIVNAHFAQGVITTVQTSSHTIAPYSFYVAFNAAGRKRQEFAFTSTLFSKQPGEKVTVLYNPDNSNGTEILALDSDWIGFLLIAVAGGLVILLSGWLYGLTPRSPRHQSCKAD